MLRSIDPRHLADHVEVLPPLPRRILRAMAEEQPSADEILGLVRADGDLAHTIIELGNSGIHDLPRMLVDVSSAVAYLGTQTIVRMVVTACMAPHFARLTRDRRQLASCWEHAITTGIAAQLLATDTGLCDPTTAFAAGLLHDLGEVLMAESATRASSELIDAAEARSNGMLEAERLVLGVEHGEVGAAIAARWGLPNALVQAVQLHHRPDLATANDMLPIAIHVADVMALQMGCAGGYGGLTYPLSQDATVRLHLAVDDVDALRLQLFDELRRSGDLMRLIDQMP